MKTYSFFYFDSYADVSTFNVKKYVVSSPRFDTAIKSFANFLRSHLSEYIDFLHLYNVSNGFKTQRRAFNDSDSHYFSVIKDKHNAKFWETYHGN